MITLYLAESGRAISISKPFKSLEEVSKEIESFVPRNSQILLTLDGAQYQGPHFEGNNVK